MKSKVKIPNLEEGAKIEISRVLNGKEFKREEFISEVKGSCLSTLFRAEENIIETSYLITTDGLSNNEKFLSSYAGRSVHLKDEDYTKLNKKLDRYEKNR